MVAICLSLIRKQRQKGRVHLKPSEDLLRGKVTMKRPSEKDLDRELEAAFRNDSVFTDWFLKMTKFHGENARYCWSRSDYPWGRVSVSINNSETGELETVNQGRRNRCAGRV